MGSVMNPQQTNQSCSHVFLFNIHILRQKFFFKIKKTNNSVTLLKKTDKKIYMKFNNNNNIGKRENVRTKLT